MNTKLTQIIKQAEALPEERQEQLAEAIASFLEEERYQHARTLEGLAEAKRGEGFEHTDAVARMKAFIARHA